MKLIANEKYISEIAGYKYDSMKYRFDTDFYKLYFAGITGDKDSLQRYADSINQITTADDVAHIETTVCPVTSDKNDGLDKMGLILSATPNELKDKDIHNKYLLATIMDATKSTNIHLLFQLDKLRYSNMLKRFENEPDEDVYIPLISNGEDFSKRFAGTKFASFKIQ